ncbi:MAG TPA: class I SAM-dependent methyltransferase [Candidatus Saccharimonadales bacterium]|nr:class I SAM-dependent methyltransferase [Candidatus Saccharimonadales bacterium]
MPYSDPRFDKTISSMIRKIKPKTVLDVGPGHGKYARLIKEINPNIRIEGVEIDRKYVKEFKLNELYDKVHINSIQKFTENQTDNNYDLVICGDVIEHLKKSEGVDILNFYVYRTKHIIVQWPHAYIQNSWEGHVHESHISVWGKSDFSNFDFKWHQKGFMRLVLIKGYLS